MMIKTKIDKTVSVFITLSSTVFLFPLYFNNNLWNSKIWIYFLSLGLILVLLGVWKYEYFKFDDKQIKKYNFLGLFVRKYLLDEMTSYKNKFTYMNYNNNPINILYFFRKDARRYLVFNMMVVRFKNGSKLKIDERSMSRKDFINIKKKIKFYKRKKAKH